MVVKLNKSYSFITSLLLLLIYSENILAQNEKSNEEFLARILRLENDSAKVDSLSLFLEKMIKAEETALGLKSGNLGLQLAKKLNYKSGQIKMYYSLGILYHNLENYTKARELFFNGLELTVSLNKKRAIAAMNENIGLTYKDEGNYTEAVKYQLNALKVYEETADSSRIAKTYMNLGNLFSNQDKTDEALNYYSLAEVYYAQKSNFGGMASVLSNKGMLFNKIGKEDSALVVLKKSNEYFQKQGNDRSLSQEKEKGGYFVNSRTLAHLLKKMGVTALINKNNTVAENYFLESEKLYLLCLERSLEAGKNINIAVDYANLGILYNAQNRYNESRIKLNESLAILQKMGNKRYLPEVYSNLSDLDSTMAADTSFSISTRLFHTEQSLNYLKLSYKAQSELVNEENDKQIAALKIQYETDKKDNKITLLNKENELQDIILREQRSALLISKLRNEKNQKEIELLNTTSAITELRLSGTQQELEKQLLKSKSEAYQLQLSKKERDLKNNELSKEKLLRGATTTGSLALLLIGLLFFNRLKLRKQLEQKEAILRQRKSISADLHDDVGSTLSSISIYSEAIKNKLMHNETDKVMDLVNKIGENARETISNLSDIVWSINPINDSGEVIFNRMETFAFSLFSSKGIKLNFTSDKSLHAIHYSIEMKQNMFLIFKEAINNCAKYSQATLVQVDIRKNGKMMNLTISDDGVGFDTKSSSTGNGLRNMQERARELNGTIDIQSMEKGTKISLSLPLAA